MFSAENLGRGQIHLRSLILEPYNANRHAWMKEILISAIKNNTSTISKLASDIPKYVKKRDEW
ncbi:MAG: hypothetical protein ACRCVW_02565 [Brevinema sp.]